MLSKFMRIDPKIKQLPTFGSHFQLQVQVLPLSDVETDQNITYPPKRLGYTDEIRHKYKVWPLKLIRHTIFYPNFWSYTILSPTLVHNMCSNNFASAFGL